MHIRVNAKLTAERLLHLFQQTDFADDRDADGVRRMLEATTVHLSAWEGHQLVGFAGCLTDGVYCALIRDVVVDEPARGRGVGSALLRAIVHELRHVDEILLGCDESLVPFYQNLGWQRDDGAVMTYEVDHDTDASRSG